MGKGLVAGLATEGTRTMTFTGTYLAMFAERGRGYFKELNVKVSDADKDTLATLERLLSLLSAFEVVVWMIPQ